MSQTDAYPPHRRQPVYIPVDVLDDDALYTERAPSSVRRYATTFQTARPPRTEIYVPRHQGQPPIQRASRLSTTADPQVAPRPTRQKVQWRFHWLACVGLGMLVMLAVWLLLMSASTWWHGMQDDWQYGRPRTAQYDVNVGHGGISHFIAVNLQGHILITEFQLSNPTRSKLYVGPTLLGAGSTLAPVTLSFRDVNGDGDPDLLIQVQGNTYVFINDHDSFRLPKQGERLSL